MAQLLGGINFRSMLDLLFSPSHPLRKMYPFGDWRIFFEMWVERTQLVWYALVCFTTSQRSHEFLFPPHPPQKKLTWQWKITLCLIGGTSSTGWFSWVKNLVQSTACSCTPGAVLHHLPFVETRRALKELKRILIPGVASVKFWAGWGWFSRLASLSGDTWTNMTMETTDPLKMYPPPN